MSVFRRIGRIVETASKSGAWIGVVGCFVMMLLVVANVISRFLWVSIPGTLDFVESLMVVVMAMFFAHTQAKRGHVGVEIVLDRLPGRVRRIIVCITLLLTLIFTLLLCWQNWLMGVEALIAKDFAVGYPHVPTYPGKLMLTIGISLLCLQFILDLFREITGLFTQRQK
jgi:TRAP-type C4-dicarboxylate transport system permease small subunit